MLDKGVPWSVETLYAVISIMGHIDINASPKLLLH